MWFANKIIILQSNHSVAYSPTSQKQVAPIRSSDHLRRPVRHRGRSELLSHRLHTAGQWELRTPADFTGAHSQGHLQVYGHFHHGVCGLHDRHVQPVLILPRSKVQPCLHHVSYTWLSEWSSVCWENVCDYVWSDHLSPFLKCCPFHFSKTFQKYGATF